MNSDTNSINALNATKEPLEESDELEDLSNTCVFCQESFTDTKQVTLECNHLCHLRCLLIHTAATHQVDMMLQCTYCNEFIINDTIQRDIFEKADILSFGNNPRKLQEDKINTLMETSEPFRTFTKEYKKINSYRKQKERIFKKKLNEIHTIYKEKIKDLFTILKGIHKSTIDSVVQTPEYKEYLKATTLFKSMNTKYSKKYDFCSGALYRRLYGRRAYFSSYRNSLIHYIIKSKFRILIR